MTEQERTYTLEEVEHYSSSVNKATADLEQISAIVRMFISNYGFDCDVLTKESEHKVKEEWNDVVNVLAHVRSSIDNVTDFLNCSLI